MRNIFYFCLAASVSFTLAACAGSRSVSQSADATDQDLTTLVQWMSGNFSSTAQSRRDSDYYDIRLHIQPIWLSDKANHWLYVEQSVAIAENKPYRQRIYKVEREEKGGFKSIVYTLPEPEKWIGAYATPARFDVLKPTDLVLREGCTVYLKKQSDGTFAGATRKNDCESNLRGAVYATSKVTISEKTLRSWDQGFDNKGKQVWGATKGAYEFVKQ